MSTAPAVLQTVGSQIVVGGDVLVQSGDALVAQTGDASIRTGFPAIALTDAPSFIMLEFPAGQTVVGGNVSLPFTNRTSPQSLPREKLA
jgi:hypothetical protein